MPYAWAPLQFFAVDGMRRYGYSEEADRLSINFGSMVLKTFLNTGEVWEKYDGVQRDETVKLKYGYPTNEIGFGWTNAVFTRFYDQLSDVGKEHLLRLDGIPIPSDLV
ncbi:family 37 glycoside hydrolase [Melampsora larici-populina 98AG31]|uniref:alpha,alpha-trehalase n=1 Tax=Melampsora larici-populina (strain 98AG31 / pathotype 3-4-7) TaxID=747676 RepID=F4R3B7_MELLP|nr:family 37 glycoside hydrolase [Melampsora larici-populina 98AG31]EGG12600.1 family 37 glycoside hydrolase [Melampsora larici-populina 98AG31]